MTALAAHGIPTTAGCTLLGVARSTYYRITRGYRHYTPVSTPIPQAQRVQPQALSGAERAAALAVLDREEYVDLSVGQVYWRGFDAGLLDCSQRTFYRIAGAAGLVGDRRRSRSGGPAGARRRKPIVEASEANQLWSWDITELRGPGEERYQLAVAIDVFSRYPLCWHVGRGQDRHEIIAMFADAFALFDVPDVLHSDNGPVMRSHDLLKALDDAGVFASFSRPRVSDDNPFSESLFKTIKYDLACPERFESLEHARAWTAQFMAAYANDHRHSGLNNYIPAAVYFGTAIHDQARRQARLDELYAANPKRFREPPKAPPLPGPTGINTKPQPQLVSQTG